MNDDEQAADHEQAVDLDEREDGTEQAEEGERADPGGLLGPLPFDAQKHPEGRREDDAPHLAADRTQSECRQRGHGYRITRLA